VDLNRAGKADGLMLWILTSRFTMSVSRTMFASVVAGGNVESVTDVNETPNLFLQDRDHHGEICMMRV
jgi:hypothetical protein